MVLVQRATIFSFTNWNLQLSVTDHIYTTPSTADCELYVQVGRKLQEYITKR